MNLEILRKVGQSIIDGNKPLEMNDWASSIYLPEKPESAEEAACETTACVAGWVCIQEGAAKFSAVDSVWEDGQWFISWSVPSGDWDAAAQEVLGLLDERNNIIDLDAADDLHSLFHDTTNEEAVGVLRALISDHTLTLREALAQQDINVRAWYTDGEDEYEPCPCGCDD